MDCGMVSSLDTTHILRASSSQLHIHVHSFDIDTNC